MMENTLRVLHYPQVPCYPFVVPVKDLEEAKLVMDLLANYDLFQYDSNIKPDYCNATTLEMWDEESDDWIDWCDEETGITDLDEYFDFISEE